jgi:hypothetical protein
MKLEEDGGGGDEGEGMRVREKAREGGRGREGAREKRA